MNFCLEHWDALRKRIDDRGLGQYVARAEQATRILNEVMSGAKDEDTDPSVFEPMLSASMAYFINVFEVVGVAMLDPDPGTGKPPCPVCVRGRRVPAEAEEWLDIAANEQLEKAKKLGLVGAG